MKLSIYFDVEPWMKPENIISFTVPYSEKSSSAKRYRVDVEIPDPVQPDVVIPGEAVEVQS